MKVVPTWDWIELQLDLHLLAQFAVQGAERLIEQEEAGPVDQRASQCDPLLLAARHLAWLPVGEGRHLHHLERLAHHAVDVVLGCLLLPKAVGDVFRDGHVGEQRIVLKDGVDVALVGRDPLHRVGRRSRCRPRSDRRTRPACEAWWSCHNPRAPARTGTRPVRPRCRCHRPRRRDRIVSPADAAGPNPFHRSTSRDPLVRVPTVQRRRWFSANTPAGGVFQTTDHRARESQMQPRWAFLDVSTLS